MSRVVELRRRRHVLQVAALALMSISVAGCSADTQRFAANPFGSSKSSPEATGSVPSGRVESHPLPQYQPTAAAPHTTPAQPLYGAPADAAGVTDGAKGEDGPSPEPLYGAMAIDSGDQQDDSSVSPAYGVAADAGNQGD